MKRYSNFIFILICFWVIITINIIEMDKFEQNIATDNEGIFKFNEEEHRLNTYYPTRANSGIKLSSDVSNVTIQMGETITVNITINNNNNESTFELKIDNSPNDWIIELEIEEITLKTMENKTFLLNVTAPIDDKLNDHININITATDKYNETITDKISIKYFLKSDPNIYNLQIFGVVHQQETGEKELTNKIHPDPGVSPGSIRFYVFEITNEWNTPTEVMIELMPEGDAWGSWSGIFMGVSNTEEYLSDVENWDFADHLDMALHTTPVGYFNNNTDPNLHNMIMNLGAGQSIWIKVQVSVPRDINTTQTGKERMFNLTCESTDNEKKLRDMDLDDNKVSMVLTIQFPDLVISGDIQHPDNITDGEILTISAEVKNDGDIEAREVMITFYVDDKEIKTQTINKLPIGASRLIPFTWQSVGGDHKLKITVDPEDTIIEKYENNNEKLKEINVNNDGNNENKDKDSTPGFETIIFVIGLLIAMIHLKRRNNYN